MNFFKRAIFILCFVFGTSFVFADNHDTQQNIVDKAKEINKKIKEKQALQNSNISSEVGKEEPLPLNDPFVGDGSLGGGTGIKVVAETEEGKRKLSIFNFNLIVSLIILKNLFEFLMSWKGPFLSVTSHKYIIALN